MLFQSQPIVEKFVFHKQLNAEKIEQFFGGDMQFCHSMFEVFLHTVPADLELLEDAVEARDFIAIKAISHKIKTNFKFVGLDAISDLIVKVESAAKNQSQDTFGYYKELKLRIEGAIAIIRAEIVRITRYLNN